MQLYFEQLKDDIRESYNNRFQNTYQIDYNAGSVLDNIPENLRPIPFFEMRPIYQWMQLDPDAFPPAEKWNGEQLKEICAMLRQLFEEYDYDLMIPFELPFEYEYKWLIKALRVEESNFLNSEHGPAEIAFCNHDTTTCPFGDFCAGEDCWGSIHDGKNWRKYE